MRSRKLNFVTACLAVALSAAFNIYAAPANTVNLPDPAYGPVVSDDDIPDVTARVARISFISGSAQIRRADSKDWEAVTLNLPLVEGDEISTGPDGRIEIQFDVNTHLRMASDANLMISKLLDAGVAVSLPQGTISIHAAKFDKAKTYFEIDAPASTVAVQHSGRYRIDAGKPGDTEMSVAVTDSGEARIYSDTSGFSLKNGRSARVFIGGSNAGEWETASAADRYTDDFDSWVAEREDAVASRMQTAAYDKYYDNDIYGAEDLNGFGEWIYTKNYGYVWRPYSSATSQYAGWSPYRYGRWSWVPPYGWTWVNDEPWGWATYHHGRWFYDSGNWYWTPYGAVRYSRSWWSPAMVWVSIWNDSICWYPLPYSYAYYNYNYYYNQHSGWGGNHGGGNHGGGGVGPTPTPTPIRPADGWGTGPMGTVKGPPRPPLGQVPPTGVVTVASDDFGRGTKGHRTAPLSVANGVLSRAPTDRQTAQVLPVNTNRVNRDTNRPPTVTADPNVRTGATTRRTDAPLDNELRTTRIFGGRPPLTVVNPMPPSGNTNRPTGAVVRPPTVTPTPDTTRRPPTVTPTNNDRPPRYEPPANTNRPPRYEPPARQDPPTTRAPRYDPPPRPDPPTTRTPRPEPPRSEPKTDKKPADPPPSTRKKPDGR